LNGFRLAIGVLVVFNVATALGVVYTKHHSRMLFKTSRATHEALDQAKVEWGRLQIEESTLARFGRIEDVATEKLGMRLPEHSEIRTVLK